jgi:CRP-like cAMP-binding protein
MPTVVTMLDLLSAHPFLDGVPEPLLRRLSYQARREIYHPGTRLFDEGHRADRFWLIRDGSVALDIAVPGRDNVVIEQLGSGSVLGWSWLSAPYRWHFGAVAVQQTLSIELDAAGVRRLCDQDPALGYELTRRFVTVLGERLQATRVRLLDLPGQPS